MDSTSYGEELYQVLLDLGITTGKIGPSDISIWFDTDDPDTLDFLHWFRTCIGEQNVLSAQEQDTYKVLCDKDLVLHEEKYKDAVEELECNYPGLFDVDSNLFEIDCLRDELLMYTDDLKYLEQQIVTNEEINNILKQKLSKTTNAELLAKHRKEMAEENCLMLCKDLAETNEKLQRQIRKYGDKLSNFFFENNPSFISNVNIEEHINYVNDVSSTLTSVVQNNKSSLFGSIMKRTINSSYASSTKNPRSIKKILYEDSFANSTAFDELTEEMQSRLESAILNNINSKAKHNEFKAILNCLSKLNIFDFSVVNDRSQFFQSQIISKAEQLASYKLEIGAIVPEVSKKFVKTPKLYAAQSEIKLYQEKLNYINKIRSHADEVLSFLWLLLLMYCQESNDIQTTDKFFREVYQYITYNLHNYKVRTEVTLDVINRYNDYKKQPIQQKYRLINDVLTLLTDGNVNSVNMQDALEIVNNFIADHKNLEQKVFCDDFFLFKMDSKILDLNLNNLKSFLACGSTSEYLAIPYKLYKLFIEVEEVLQVQKDALNLFVNLKVSVEKKLNNKWLKLRRQLWMYFMSSPKHMATYMNHIEKEVQNSIKSSYL